MIEDSAPETLNTYSDVMTDWLIDAGYTHCFFVSGGNIMHLLNAIRERLVCIPVVHEVAAGIAAEYFNTVRTSTSGKAFALVTAGPGLTNIVTAVAGAWLESRTLLVIGGQVKSSDLSDGSVRQMGLQEINGIEIVSPITKAAVRITTPIAESEFKELLTISEAPRCGPVFLEVCLDAQGTKQLDGLGTTGSRSEDLDAKPALSTGSEAEDVKAVDATIALLRQSSRPVLLIGGGVDYEVARDLQTEIGTIGIPVMTTWNGADRVSSTNVHYWGRPNHFGQRAANVLLQQADLVIAVGTRLGIQQTGFNWQQFAPLAHLVQVDIDPNELHKESPAVDLPIQGDANQFLQRLVNSIGGDPATSGAWDEWRRFGAKVREDLLPEIPGVSSSGTFVNPYELMVDLCELLEHDAIICPSSSGGTFTGAYQALHLRDGQRLISNKSLASMGYGLAGAIGLAFAQPSRQIVLLEGDGGFAQNLQELGTVAINNLNILIFVFDNAGYGSIRTTQKSYFNGTRVGCDKETGLGLPDWAQIAGAYGVPYLELPHGQDLETPLVGAVTRKGPLLVRVVVDPEQDFHPKITSRIDAHGRMESNPLHLMSPEMDEQSATSVLRYLVGVDGPSEVGNE